ncbi:MAG: response regulator [Acidobacteria bacterium]|nr:response regulator [Acidobacteriota bacterium]
MNRFPMATLRVGDPSSSTKVMYAHATDTQATVLVLDDEASVRKVMGRVLGKRGYRVIEVDTAARAVDVLRTTPVHAVVLDVRLPEGSGLDVLSPLRRPVTEA